jgi:hypothetical protein
LVEVSILVASKAECIGDGAVESGGGAELIYSSLEVTETEMHTL